MPVRTSHACTGPSELLPVRTTSSRKFATAAIASVVSSSGRASGVLCDASEGFEAGSAVAGGASLDIAVLLF